MLWFILLTVITVFQNHVWGWQPDNVRYENAPFLGDPCTSSEACQRGVSESQCVAGLCTCPPYHVAYNATACLRTSLLGFECLVDAQCSVRVQGSGCVDGLCQCSQNLVPHRRHLCLPPALPGDKCYSTEQCLGGDKQSYCKYIVPKVYGRCICQSTAQHVGKTCLKLQPTLGTPCTHTRECSHNTPASTCRIGLCQCEIGSVRSTDGLRCIRALKGIETEIKLRQVTLGLPCTAWAQCQAADPNAACIHGICTCTVGQPICEGTTPGCFNNTYQCRSSGQCISPAFVCNGISDCEDGSDEECTGLSCPPQSFRCDKGQPACISQAWVCDGKPHCSDGSDEQYCHVRPGSDHTECPGNGFKCGNGTCLPEHVYCNGILDCGGGAANDEPEKACKREFQPVEECPFRCKNGRCRSSSILCSGVNGCGDNSDEEFCRVCRCPAISQWRI